MFKVSDKVICVKSVGHWNEVDMVPINKGDTIYVIREIDDAISIDDSHFGQALRFTGIYNPIPAGGIYEPAYDARRFRKLEDIQQENRLKREAQVPCENVNATAEKSSR